MEAHGYGNEQAQSSPDDAYHLSKRVFGELLGWLEEEGQQMNLTAGQLEDQLFEGGTELLRCLLEDHFNVVGDYEAEGPIKGVEGVLRTHHKLPARNLETRFGTVRIWRKGYGGDSVRMLIPADGELNLPKEKFSHPLQRLVCEEISKCSYEETHRSIQRYTAAHVAKAQVQGIAERGSQDFDAFYEQRHEAAKAEARSEEQEATGSLLVLTTDGKGVVVRHDALRKQTRKKAEGSEHKLSKRLSTGEKNNRKRMAQVASVYTQEPFVRTAEDVASELYPKREHGRVRPRPENKRVWAKIKEDAREVFKEVFEEGLGRDPNGEKRWVALVDGNKHQLKMLSTLAVQYGVTLTIILDVIHVLEYLWKAAWVFHSQGDPAAQSWVSKRLHRVLQGQASRVAAGIRQSATKQGLDEDARKAADKCADYLLNNKDYLHYDEYLASGLPIGTGVIEGACRYLVKDRMDITGARWGLEGADAVLKLRALRASGDFPDYWVYHQRCEYERNHMSRYAQGVPKLTPPHNDSEGPLPRKYGHLTLLE